jgi:hypothetical protein
METSKESRQYLAFFSRYKLHFVVPALVVGVAAYSYQYQKPERYHSSIILEMEYTERNVQERVILTDEAVTLARAEQVKGQLGIPSDSLNVHKGGPLLVSIDTADKSFEDARISEQKMVEYLQQKFPLQHQGVVYQYSYKTNPLVSGLAGVALGAVFGLFTSLLTEYFRKY